MMSSGTFLLLFTIFLSISYAEITFIYKTSYNGEGKSMTKNDVQEQSVNILRPIILVINGLNSSDDAWVEALVNEYLEKQNHNVFLLNLKEIEKGGNNHLYEDIAEFIEEVYKKTKERYLSWHLIGIGGRGSNITSETGRRISNNSTKKFSRVTLLDPSFHSNQSAPSFIDDDVATLIDVVHSNVRKFKTLGHYGHVDFYIDDINCKETPDLDCGYLNAVKMFKRSINSEKLTAVQCASLQDFEADKCATNSRVLFGENMPSNADGLYILKND